ncbi:MAG: hypothetical protein DRH43_10895 [Deltaproteobacteria bacterium]|nr:MAG: hypothetical protein DRH43_10895 [Deltaproteobacteria bacterium]
MGNSILYRFQLKLQIGNLFCLLSTLRRLNQRAGLKKMGVGYFVTLHEMFKSGLKILKKQIRLLLVDMLIIWLSIELGCIR